MIIKAKAPLRLGLAGGGTDVSPYSNLYGGAVLNTTVSLYARAMIEPLDNKKIILESNDLDQYQELESTEYLDINGELPLLKGVYNRIVKDYTKKPLSFKLTTIVDVPKGSGLGTSSTLTVAILGAFVEWLDLPLGDYEIAQLAYQIERNDLQLAGGKQDQYAATFGGFNFIEFGKDDLVTVNPLRVKNLYKNQLEWNLILFYTGTSRDSADIINDQAKGFKQNQTVAIQAAHNIKKIAYQMKRALLKGNINNMGELLDESWKNKKLMSNAISNTQLDNIYNSAIAAGATGGKISGAGGGGFMMFYCPGNSKQKVIDTLSKYGGRAYNFVFEKEGLYTFTVKTH
jgi:D-glycero-alpha-D-manno-heptose-7-phosphate kinase